MDTTVTGEHVLHSFDKSPREKVQARLRRLSGRPFADIRVYYEAESDDEELTYLPTKKGICIRVEQLPELRAAVAALEEEAARVA